MTCIRFPALSENSVEKLWIMIGSFDILRLLWLAKIKTLTSAWQLTIKVLQFNTGYLRILIAVYETNIPSAAMVGSLIQEMYTFWNLENTVPVSVKKFQWILIAVKSEPSTSKTFTPHFDFSDLTWTWTEWPSGATIFQPHVLFLKVWVGKYGLEKFCTVGDTGASKVVFLEQSTKSMINIRSFTRCARYLGERKYAILCWCLSNGWRMTK